MHILSKRALRAWSKLLSVLLLVSTLTAPVQVSAKSEPEPPTRGQGSLEEPESPVAARRKAALARLTPVSRDEAVELRGANQRVFRTPEGGYRVDLYARPVHYQTTDGVYEPIDNTIITERQAAFALRNKGNFFTARFTDTPGAQKVQVEWGDKRIALGLDEASEALKTTHKGNEVHFGKNGFPFRYRYEVQDHKIKEEIILERFTGKTTWRFPLEVEGLVPVTSEDGRIQLMRKEAINEVGATIEPAFAVDATGVRTDNVTQRLIEQNGQYRIELTVDEAWLKSPDRAWPVTIDPTVNLPVFGLETAMWAQITAGDSTPDGAVDNLLIKADSTRNLFKFDLTKVRWQLAADVGKPMQLTSAVLQLDVNPDLTVAPYCSGSSDPAGCGADVFVEPLARDWIMQQVTWTQPRWNNPSNPSEQNWMAGGEVCTAQTCLDLPAEALLWTTTPETMFFPWRQLYELGGDPYEIPLTPLVQRWLDGFPNYGIRIRLQNAPGLSNVRAYWDVDYQAPNLSMVFEIDRTKPEVAITSPSQDSSHAGSVTVQVSASDKLDNLADGRLSRIQLLVDGNLVHTVTAHAAGDYSLAADLSGYPAGKHRLTARAYDLAGNYQDSSVDVMVTDGLLAAPAHVRVAPTSGTTYNLAWAPAKALTLDGVIPPTIMYVVERATNDRFTDAVTVGTTTGLSMTDTTPTMATYYWRVRAITPNGASVPSAPVAATAPISPAHLTATPVGNSQVLLSWPASPTAADDPNLSYRVYRNGSLVSPAGLAGTTWTDSVTAGATYSYQVAAVDKAGRVSALTEAVSVVATATSGPSAPTAVRAIADQGNRIALVWTPLNSTTAKYRIYRSTDGVNWTLLTPDPISSWFYLDGGLTEGTTYYYQVETIDGGVAGPRSATTAAMAAPTRRLGVDDRWTMLPFGAFEAAGYVNLQNGNVVLQATDAVLPGPVFANVLRRTYNSQGCLTCSALGGGWRLNAEWRLERGESHIVITEGDGSEIRFRPGATAGTWVPDEPRYFWELTEEANGTYALRQPNEIVYRFDTTGRLTEIQDRTGNELTYTYDGLGRLYQVTNSANRACTFVYDSYDRLMRVDFPTSRSVRYDYDAAGRLSSVTDPDGRVTAYSYDSDGRLDRITDPSGRWVSLAYDAVGRISSWTDGSGNRFRITYTGTGRAALTDPQGAQTQFEFNGYGWLTKLTDAEQVAKGTFTPWTSAYNMAALPWTITVTNPRGLVTVARFDERGNVLEVEELGADLVAPGVNSRITRFYYGGTTGINNAGPNDLYKVVDPEGNETQTYYTATGPRRVERVVDAEGGSTTYTYDTTNLGMIRTITDANNNVTTYNYTPSWDVSSIVRDVFNPVTNTTTRLQQVFEYQDGMVTGQSEMHEQGTANPPMIRTVYDGSGRILRVNYPDGSQESSLFDASGNLGVVVDRAGLRLSYVYDAAGRVVAQTAKDGGVVRYTYTGLNPTAVEGPDGLVTQYAYDKLYRTVATKNPDQTVTRVKYDEVGNAVEVLNGPAELFDDPDSSKAYKVTATYYLANLVQKVTEPVPSAAILAAAGAPGNPGCAGTGTDCNTQTYAYNKNGQVLSLTDGNGYRTTYQYDRVGRLRFATDPLGNAAEYVYDKVGNKIEVYKPGYPRLKQDPYDGNYYATKPDQYIYDGLNRLVKERTSVTGVYRDRIYTYNAAGDLIQETQTLADVSTYYEYNASHQVTRISYTNSDVTPEVRFVMDAGGRRLLRSDAYGNTWYDYDLMGRVTQVRGLVDQVSYEYDVAGRRSAMTFNLGRVTYSYSQGRLSQISDPLGNVSTFGYDEYGHNTTISLPNADLTNTFYRMPNLPSGEAGPVTNRLQKKEWKNKAGTSVFWSGTYRYDHPGNVRESKLNWHSSIATSTNKLPSSQTITYTYDQGYRLTKWNDNSPYKNPNDYVYEYNAAGDRTNAGNTYVSGKLRWQTPSGTKVSLERIYYFDDSHELIINSAFAPNYEQVGPYGASSNTTYNASGSLTSETYYKTTNTTGIWDYRTIYSYDDAQRLTRSEFEPNVPGCGGSFRWFKYDGDGRMTDAYSAVPGGCSAFDRTSYGFDGQTVITESGSNGNNLVWYITVPGNPKPLYSLRLRNRDLKPDTHITDHLGSTVEVVDSTGKISNWYAYDPFGQIEGSSVELLNSYTFTSSVRDHVTGLYFMGARVYNASSGRFLTQDTHKGSPWMPWTQNLYVYVANNPVNYTDPTGHCFWDACLLEGAALVAAVGVIAVGGAIIGRAIGEYLDETHPIIVSPPVLTSVSVPSGFEGKPVSDITTELINKGFQHIGKDPTGKGTSDIYYDPISGIRIRIDPPDARNGDHIHVEKISPGLTDPERIRWAPEQEKYDNQGNPSKDPSKTHIPINGPSSGPTTEPPPEAPAGPGNI